MEIHREANKKTQNTQSGSADSPLGDRPAWFVTEGPIYTNQCLEFNILNQLDVNQLARQNASTLLPVHSASCMASY
jgi:hypothetical protein